MALTKLSTDSIDLSGNTTALTIPSGTTGPNTTDTTGTCNYPTTGAALYQLNNDGGSTNNVPDTCGSYNGTSTDITYAAGKYGNAAQFNGSTSLINLPDNSIFDLAASTSLSFWVYRTNSTSHIINKGNPESYAFWWGTNYYLSIYTSAGATSLITSTANTTSTWYNFVITVDSAGTGYKLYMDANLEASVTSGTININTGDVRIGSYPNGSYDFGGALDQIRWFNTTLSPTQVTELYNETNVTNTTGRPTSPSEGLLRDNTTTGALEFYDGSLWQEITGTLVPDNAPSSNFNTVLYTGNGSTQSITGVGFKPDFVWLKNEASQNHYLMDSVRGPTCGLFSAVTDAEFCSSNYLTSFDSDGFTTGSTNNISSNAYVSWNWKAGGSGSDNFYIDGTGYGTASAASLDGGTITPTGASINTATGFSIVKYTGNDTQDATYNTGLTVTSDFVITKSTSTMSWYIWSSALPSATNYLKFDTSGQNTTYTPLYPTNPVSGGAGVFKIGSDQGVNESTKSYIAYHFANIIGYQQIGTYDGNGLSTGNMVTTGFEPAFLMVKEISTSGGYWYIVDNKRNTSNPRSLNLFPNDIGAQASYGSFDFLPTGFQPANNWGDTNGSGQTYIYLAISS
jgi:hypothetical protein